MTQENGQITEHLEGQLREALGQMAFLSEAIPELEDHLQTVGWLRLFGGDGRTEFSRSAIGEIAGMARLMYLKNPIIRRGVDVQALYVWAQGINVKARDPRVEQLVRQFWDDQRNKAELTSHQAQTAKEKSLQVDGNVFLVLFEEQSTGQLTVRSIPMDEVSEIITNPEDRREPWFYKREWDQERIDAAGSLGREHFIALYPDWRYQPATRPANYRNLVVRWGSPVYHLAVGNLDGQKFGISETYPAQDWASAYKRFLEQVATIMAAYSRFIGQLKVGGSPRAAEAASARLNTQLSTSERGVDRNPPPVTGSVLTTTTDTTFQLLQARGASVDPEDGRRLLLMAIMVAGLPETFYGDVSVGTLATAESLDRPTEIKFRDRQQLWQDCYSNLLQFQIDKSIAAPKGYLRGLQRPGIPDARAVLLTDRAASDPEKELDATLDVDFPPIVVDNVGERVTAVVSAGTLNGNGLAGTFDLETLRRLLLIALGQDDVDEIMERLKNVKAPEPPEDPGPDNPEDTPPPPDAEQEAARAQALAHWEGMGLALAEGLARIYGYTPERAAELVTERWKDTEEIEQ